MPTSTLVDFAVFSLVGGRALQLAVFLPGSTATPSIGRFGAWRLFSGCLSSATSIALAVLCVSAATRSRSVAIA